MYKVQEPEEGERQASEEEEVLVMEPYMRMQDGDTLDIKVGQHHLRKCTYAMFV
jgi:hypothetical protein